ncbi:hypothetical protein BC833DRAFT_589849 [Globomyces pollinis-pini]|nr:hypothetical protein BC833DRAFT_589849 [Globomyces pollinis-pini]KAJ2997188.1 hypothetical protein HDV02_005786 [Globomyces sp. JEL0801]
MKRVSSRPSLFTSDQLFKDMILEKLSLLSSKVLELEKQNQQLNSKINLLSHIESGEIQFHQIFCSGSTLTKTKSIDFTNPFKSIPIVNCWIKKLDIDKDRNTRVDVSAVNITKNGFEIVGKSWWDSQTFEIVIGWEAREGDIADDSLYTLDVEFSEDSGLDTSSDVHSS